MPYFSVVLITYNREDLLPRCIDSVINQTFQDWELIIVDNYSEDGSKELIESYQSRDSRISLIQVHNNNVLAYSRNVGIKAAKGKYICILDSDDWYTLDKLQKVYDVCQQKEHDVIYNRYRLMSSKGKGRVCGKPLTWNNKFYEILIVGTIICNTTVVVKKEAVESVGYLSEEPSLRAVEDNDLWLRLAKDNRTFYYINECLGYYWIGNNMSYSPKQVTQLTNLYNKFIPDIEPNMVPACISCRDYTIGRIYHKIGEFQTARRYYKSVIPSQPIKRKLMACILVFLTWVKVRF